MALAHQDPGTHQDTAPNTVRAYPARFRAAEGRSRRLGRVLRAVAGVKHVDEELMARIGRALDEVDEAGSAVATAMRLPAGTPGRVSRRRLNAVLAGGPGYGAPA